MAGVVYTRSMVEPYRTTRARTTPVGAIGGLVALALTSAVGSASASGFLYTRFGGDYGQPALGSGHSVYFNPAAIGEVQGHTLTLDGMFAYRVASYERPASSLSPSAGKSTTDPVYVAANTGKATASGLQVAPYVAFTTDLGGSGFFLGLASYVPEGGASSFAKATSWQNDKRAPGAYDGPQRWALVSGSQISWWNTLAVGKTFEAARLHVGLSVSLVRDSLESLIARNKDGSDDLATSSGLVTEGRSLVKVSGLHAAVALGVHYRPLADGSLRLGASYTSPQGLGESRLAGTLRTQFGAAVDKTQDVDLLMSFPDVVRVGGALRVSPLLDLRLDLEWVRWSRLQRQCVVVAGAACNVDASGAEQVPAGADAKVLLNLDRQWKDAYALRAGLGVFPTSSLELMGSVGFDTSPVPKARLDATYVDGFKLLVSAGARYKVSGSFYVGATLTEMYMLPVDSTGVGDNLGTLKPPSRSPNSGGKYRQSLTFLDLSVGVRL